MNRVKNTIGWADYSWNPVSGCTLGCYYCYARRMAYRLRGRCGYDQEEPFRPTWHGDKLLEPYYLKRPSRIFTYSMGEIFDPEADDIWRDLIFHVMWRCDQHIFQVLTKQAKRILTEMMDDEYVPPNLWLGLSQDGKTTDPKDMEDFCFDAGAAAIKFVSCEPLLGPIEIPEIMFDWIIIGAQTGPGAKQPRKEWIHDILLQAEDNKTPVFVKNNVRWSGSTARPQEFPDKKRWRRI